MTTRVRAGGIASNTISNAMLKDDSVDSDILANAINITAGQIVYPGMPLQVQNTNFNTHLSYGSADGTGVATGVTGGFSVIPSNIYVNVTAVRSNSKYFCMFDGNSSTSADSTLGDWIGGFGFVVDPAGGTSWTQFASGTNTSNTNNIKFFSARADASGAGNDTWWSMQLCGNAMYTSTAAAGATLRFAIEYFHYDYTTHETLYINRRSTSSAQAGNASYQGGLATSLTVWEIAT
jgi:hypothetical protein